MGRKKRRNTGRTRPHAVLIEHIVVRSAIIAAYALIKKRDYAGNSMNILLQILNKVESQNTVGLNPLTTRAEAVSAVIRAMYGEAEAAMAEHRKLQAPYGTMAAGAGAFGPFLRYEGLRAFTDAFNSKRDPIAAGRIATKAVRYAIKVHNSRRPRDVNWKRAPGHGDQAVQVLVRRVQAAGG